MNSSIRSLTGTAALLILPVLIVLGAGMMSETDAPQPTTTVQHQAG